MKEQERALFVWFCFVFFFSNLIPWSWELSLGPFWRKDQNVLGCCSSLFLLHYPYISFLLLELSENEGNRPPAPCHGNGSGSHLLRWWRYCKAFMNLNAIQSLFEVWKNNIGTTTFQMHVHLHCKLLVFSNISYWIYNFYSIIEGGRSMKCIDVGK